MAEAGAEIPQEFLNFLMVEQARAIDVTLEDRRATAIRAYMGEPYGDEVEGRSQAVTRDVSEVVDFMAVGILDTIIASGKAVQFESEPEPDPNQPPPQPQMAPQQPQGQPGPIAGTPAPQAGQPQGAPPQELPAPPPAPVMVNYGEEATAAIQYGFMRQQKGYRILHDALKAGLLEKSGIVKTYAEMQPAIHEEREVLGGMIEGTEPDENGDASPHIQGVPVISATPMDEGWQEGMPALMWKATLAHPQPPKFFDVAIPNEFFRVAPDAIDLDDAIYVGERTPKTMSDLVKLGYDPEVLEALWSSAPGDTIVEQARDAERSQSRLSVGQRTGADKLLWLDEEYPLYDLDGDGIAERLFVHRIGHTVLKVMPISEQPYSLWSPFPMQHRLIGQSMADKTMDIQRIRSVLMRQALDSLYISNSPRTLIDESSITVDTIDDILTVRPGGLIRYRGTAPAPLAQDDTSATAFQGMEMMSAERESRTGVTRQSQGLNPDATNHTATGMAMLMANSSQIQLYVVRNFAEMLVAQMFAKRYRLMRELGQPFRMKVEGKYKTIDPAKWPEEIDMTINVGLGTGNKDQKLQYRMQLLGVQQQIIAGGLPIVGPEEVYQNVKGLVEDSGIGVASDYIKDPATVGPQPPRPDPAMAKAQGDAMLAQQKEQNAHDQAMAHLSIQEQQTKAEAAIKAQSHALEQQTKRDAAAQAAQLADAKAGKEAQLADDKQAFEMDLAERKFQFDAAMAKKKHDAMVAQASVSSDRPGGSLAE